MAKAVRGFRVHLGIRAFRGTGVKERYVPHVRHLGGPRRDPQLPANPSGSTPPPNLSMTAVYNVAVNRTLAWGRAEKLPLTFFVVGSDLERALARDKIAEAAAFAVRRLRITRLSLPLADLTPEGQREEAAGRRRRRGAESSRW